MVCQEEIVPMDQIGTLVDVGLSTDSSKPVSNRSNDDPISSPYTRERDIYGRKPKSWLGRVFNFKLGSLTDNTINSLNANGHF